ncbi:hypothetical protein ACGYU5_15245 [Burkholderia pseudomallei]
MNIAELIEALDKLKAERGNLAVNVEVNGMFSPVEAPVSKTQVFMTDEGFEDQESVVLGVPVDVFGGAQ